MCSALICMIVSVCAFFLASTMKWQEMNVLMIYEPAHDKTYKKTCAASEERSVCASTQSDQSSLIAYAFCSLRVIHRGMNKNPCHTITKTYLYNFDLLKPHFYIEKLGFTGVYIIFLISAQKHRLWVLVRTASMRRF